MMKPIRPGLLLLISLLLVLQPALVAAKKCNPQIFACKKCSQDDLSICEKCKKGYQLNTARTGCICAAGFGSTVDPTVTDAKKSFPRSCQQWQAGDKVTKTTCQCRKCPKGSSGMGGPVALARCTAPIEPETFPTAAASLSLSYVLNGYNRWLVNVGIGTPPQPASLVVDTGSASLYTCAYTPSASSTAVNASKAGWLGYGSGPVSVNFWADNTAVSGFTPTGASTTLQYAGFPFVADKGFQSSCVPTVPQTVGGLVGLAPPGGLTGGTGNTNSLNTVAGAMCLPASGSGALTPCNNAPPFFKGLLAANSLPAMFALTLGAPSTEPFLNQDIGDLYLGGLPNATQGSGPQFVTTPLMPNLYRTDFATGSASFVFWQFNPLSIDLEYADGSSANLCNSTAAGGIGAAGACIAIADTGYSAVVVNNNASRAELIAATQPNAALCGTRLWVTLPTSVADTVGRTIAFDLSAGGGADCGRLINNNAYPSADQGTVFTSPPQQLLPFLPANWWVFGQPFLQQMMSVYDFTAFDGVGGLHFEAPSVTPTPEESFVVVAVTQSQKPPNTDSLPPALRSTTFPPYAYLTCHKVSVGTASSGAVQNYTIDSGSGLMMLASGGQPWCTGQNTPQQYVPTNYWTGCLAQGQPACGYDIPNFNYNPELVVDGQLVAGDGNAFVPNAPCWATQILEPGNSITSGPVTTDTLLVVDAVTGATTTVPNGKVQTIWYSFNQSVTDFDYNNTALDCNLATLPLVRTPCGIAVASEAGHERSAGSLPTMMYQSGVVSSDFVAMCQMDQTATTLGQCSDVSISNAYMIYGMAVPNNKKVQAAMQKFPMLTQDEAKQASAALGWSGFFASRMNSRYLAKVASMSFALANGKQAAPPVSFMGWNGVVNLDTGALAALQIGQAAFDAWSQATLSQVQALNNTKGYTIQRCDLCSGGNVNTNASTACFMISVVKPSKSNAQSAASFLMQVFPTITVNFATASGATVPATVNTAAPVTSCDNSLLYACSYPSASNQGIPTPLWFANPFFNDRFVGFDRQGHNFWISPQGDPNTCTSGFVAPGP